jgi:hypothetical protein
MGNKEETNKLTQKLAKLDRQNTAIASPWTEKQEDMTEAFVKSQFAAGMMQMNKEQLWGKTPLLHEVKGLDERQMLLGLLLEPVL